MGRPPKVPYYTTTQQNRAYRRALQDLKDNHDHEFVKLFRERLENIDRDDKEFRKQRAMGTKYRPTKHRPDSESPKYCVECDKPVPCDGMQKAARRRAWKKWEESDGPKCPGCNIKIPQSPASIKTFMHYHCPTCQTCLHKRYPTLKCEDYVPPKPKGGARARTV